MFYLRFSLRTSKVCLIFVSDKRQYCHNNKLTNVKIMTFYESASKHEAFNDVLQLMNSKDELRNPELFEAVYNLAIKQGEVTGQLLEQDRKNR